MDILRRSQQNLEMQQRAAEVDALRQQRQQQKTDSDAAHAIASRYVTALAADPTSVDVGALARENFPDSQQDTRQALLGAAQTAIAQAGDKTATGYGPGFWQIFNRVTAPGAAEAADEIATGERGVRGAGGRSGAPLSSIPRVPFPENFPDIVIQQPRGSRIWVQEDPDYKAAKAGDTDAATRLVDAVVNEGKMKEVETLIGDSKPTVVAVHSGETGRNAIPRAYAELVGEWFGLPVANDIVQINRPGRTRSTAEYRMLNRTTFDGPVTPGQNYLLVDDNVTQGGTLSDLRSYIESKGGRVIGATTLMGGEDSQFLAPRPETLEALRRTFPKLESRWEQTYKHRFDSLTESEAQYLLDFQSESRIWNKLAPPQAEKAGGEGP
jgi:hypothetical protein